MFPNTTGEAVLAGEFLLCQGLRFAFDVKHPFRALEGAIMELRRYGDLDVSVVLRC
jgi:cyclin H